MAAWSSVRATIDRVIGFNRQALVYNVSVVRFFESPIANLFADAFLHGTGSNPLSPLTSPLR